MPLTAPRRQRRLPWLACLALAACGSWDLQPITVPRDLPKMPERADLDYLPLAGTAHAALPIFDPAAGRFTGPGRIWVKGSAAWRRARVAGTTVTLEPPYYTAVVEAPAGRVAVEFDDFDGVTRTVHVAVPDAERLNTPGDFSTLFFGDFQPFTIRDGAVLVNRGDPVQAARAGRDPIPTLLAIRAMLRAAAEGELGGMLPPRLLCGYGDQVYVEGDYDKWPEYGQNHPMSAWTVEGHPRPRVSVSDLPRFLDVCYRGNWSFTTLERAFAACPSVMTWDDHDIRDGWGSQGDEHVYSDHFRVFRDAYVVHQFAHGPRRVDREVADPSTPLWQSFVVAGVPFFMLDLRTSRDVTVPTVIGTEQWRVLKEWFASLDPARSRHYVLVSSVPLFYRIADRADLAASFEEEVRDDLLDTWTSAANESEWLQVIAEITKAGARGMRGLIVSGDYHLASLCRVTATPEGGGPEQIVAYELMAAGLAADGYSGWKQELVREGSFLDTPIEVSGRSLSVEFGLVESCPSFAGMELVGGELFANIFEANADGCGRYRVPLSFAPGAESLSAALDRGWVAIDPEPLCR
jgi:hypothetical protein